MNEDLSEIKAKLLGSLLLFTQTFYKLRTGREFVVSQPISRESHHIEICRALTTIMRGQTTLLNINVPPRYGKTELLIHFIAWGLAHYPDSNNIYVSYSHSLAKKQTQTIKQIVESPYYRYLFGVQISEATSAKDNFETTKGGSVYAVGSKGTITGRGAGIQYCERYGGCIAIDDIIKPAEATSDVIREEINDWYYNTLLSRLNNPSKTPIINIGQRTHEHDLSSIISKDDNCKNIILKSLDNANNALNHAMHTKQQLLKMKEENPYVFAAQYQQDPLPSGGGIFDKEWLIVLEHEPEILATFITADTAETDKDYNDATVFSFWGVYKLNQDGIQTDIYGLHWINCLEIRVQPKDLKSHFMDFYASCMRYPIKPYMAAIEKKSTGVTLLSILSDMQGLQIIDIDRTKASGNKTSRYLEIQSIVAAKRVSLPMHAKHVNLCKEHVSKITANNSHRFDDVMDTLYDAVRIGLIDEIVPRGTITKSSEDDILDILASEYENFVHQNEKLRTWQR